MEKVSPNKVGERIRAVRGKQTQTEFAHVLGVKKQNYISRYERGRIPSPDLLVRIAEVGRVTTDWLLTGKRGGARGTALSQQTRTLKKSKPAAKSSAKPAAKAKSQGKSASKPKTKTKSKAKLTTKEKAKPVGKLTRKKKGRAGK